MVIISRPVIRDFAARHPLSAKKLNDWYEKTVASDWSSFSEVKKTFNSCDGLGKDRYVFNIGGNHIRLIAMIFFKKRTLYIRGIFTHEEYANKSNRGELDTL